MQIHTKSSGCVHMKHQNEMGYNILNNHTLKLLWDDKHLTKTSILETNGDSTAADQILCQPRTRIWVYSGSQLPWPFCQLEKICLLLWPLSATDAHWVFFFLQLYVLLSVKIIQSQPFLKYANQPIWAQQPRHSQGHWYHLVPILIFDVNTNICTKHRVGIQLKCNVNGPSNTKKSYLSKHGKME